MKTYKCPQCGSENISVTASVAILPTENAPKVLGDPEWSNHDSAQCLEDGCDWNGEAGCLKFTRARKRRVYTPEQREAARACQKAMTALWDAEGHLETLLGIDVNDNDIQDFAEDDNPEPMLNNLFARK